MYTFTEYFVIGTIIFGVSIVYFMVEWIIKQYRIHKNMYHPPKEELKELKKMDREDLFKKITYGMNKGVNAWKTKEKE